MRYLTYDGNGCNFFLLLNLNWIVFSYFLEYARFDFIFIFFSYCFFLQNTYKLDMYKYFDFFLICLHNYVICFLYKRLIYMIFWHNILTKLTFMYVVWLNVWIFNFIDFFLYLQKSISYFFDIGTCYSFEMFCFLQGMSMRSLSEMFWLYGVN